MLRYMERIYWYCRKGLCASANHGGNIYSDKKGNHINGLEGFWGYLKRKLAAKGGVRQARLHLYLGEYVWRYNHRTMNSKEREKLLVSLLDQTIRSG